MTYVRADRIPIDSQLIAFAATKIQKPAEIEAYDVCMRFSIQPRDYPLSLRAMTKEKLQFELPVVFTIGPSITNTDDRTSQGDALVKYATLLADSDEEHIESVVKGIIEGETRVVVSAMTIEEIFAQREQLKKRIYVNIQTELDQFGLRIYNANVKELRDAPNSTYFASLSMKAHEGASNQARIDVAEAQYKGNVGEAERHARQSREIAKINADTAVQNTERQIEEAQAKAKLESRKATFDGEFRIAQIEADRATESRYEELQADVEARKAEKEMQKLRATTVVPAITKREADKEAAEGKSYDIEAEAKAKFFRESKLAESRAYEIKVQSLAEAEGISKKAEGYLNMAQAFGGAQGLIKYLMIDKETYINMARANADAVHGMQPKITVWNTGTDAGGSADDVMATIRSVYQMLPPLMTTVNEQAGITPPEWLFGKLTGNVGEKEKGFSGIDPSG